MKITHKRDYRQARRDAYPAIGDQLDAVYKLALALQSQMNLPAETQAWINQINEVKTSYRKQHGKKRN